jgi:hypothetical protein
MRKPPKPLMPADFTGEGPITAKDLEVWRADLGAWIADLRAMRTAILDAADDVACHAKEMAGVIDEAEGAAGCLLALAMGLAAISPDVPTVAA